MKKLGIIIVGVFMFTFFSSFLHLIFGDSMDPGTKMAHKISAQIGRNLKAKYGLEFMGISEEGPDGKYICIGLEFYQNRIITQDEGRVLLLNCAEEALATFNSHPKFRPYMNNYPFTGDNIIVNIYIHDRKGYRVYYPTISVFGFMLNRLVYSTVSPYKQTGYFTRDEEPLEEARKIVAEQRAGTLPFIKSK